MEQQLLKHDKAFWLHNASEHSTPRSYKCHSFSSISPEVEVSSRGTTLTCHHPHPRPAPAHAAPGTAALAEGEEEDAAAWPCASTSLQHYCRSA